MEATVRAALRHGVVIGAHPSYPDREQFGRREIPATPEQVEAFVLPQVVALGAVAARLGAQVAHVKPHGALVHVAGRDPAVARAIARAAEQAVRIARGDGVVAVDGSVVQVEAQTISVHGDTPGAVGIARAVPRALEEEGFEVRAGGNEVGR